MLLARLLLIAGALLAPVSAYGQSTVLQGGPWTNGHVPIYATQGSSQAVVIDGGPAGGGPIGVGLSELNITSRGTGPGPYPNSGTGPNHEHSCMYDVYVTSGSYHYLCFDPNALGGGLISYGAVNAPQEPLQFLVNGVIYQFPFSSGGVVGPPTTVVGDAACWNNATGTLLKDCALGQINGQVSASQIATGAASANIGTLGGKLTGTLPNPGCVVATTGATGCVSVDGVSVNVSGAGQLSAGSGTDTNALNAVSSNYTIAPIDCGHTIQLGGGGQFTISLPAVTGFPANCSVIVKNGDTARGKILAGFPAGTTSYDNLLWPLQALTVKIINGAWSTTVIPGLYTLQATVTLNVDATLGNDSNDCLATATSACATIQAAMNHACFDFNAAQQAVQIKVHGNITLSSGILLCHVTGSITDGYLSHSLYIFGDAPSAATVVACGANVCFTDNSHLGGWEIDAVTMTGTGGCVEADANGWVYVGNVVCNAGGVRLLASFGGRLELVGGNYQTGGPANAEMEAIGGHSLILCKGGLVIGFGGTSQAVIAGSIALALDNGEINCGGPGMFPGANIAPGSWVSYEAATGGGIQQNNGTAGNGGIFPTNGATTPVIVVPGWYANGDSTTFPNGQTGNNNIVVMQNSPALTGAPTAPTQNRYNYTTNLATTAFVMANAVGEDANKFRNGTMDVAQRGVSGTVSSGTSAYTLDGWILGPTGNNIIWQQTLSQLTITGYANALQITGAAGVTDVQMRQRIENFASAPLANTNVTVQFNIVNALVGGLTLTPTLTVKHANAANNWGAPVTDVNAVPLQTINGNALGTVCYTYTSPVGATNGVEVTLDLGPMSSASSNIYVTAADIRVTPGLTVGQQLLASCPLPGIRPIGREMSSDLRYYYEVNEANAFLPFTAACTATNTITSVLSLPVPMLKVPTTTVTVGGLQAVINGAAGVGLTGTASGTNTVNTGVFTTTNTCTAGQTVMIRGSGTTGNIAFSSEL